MAKEKTGFYLTPQEVKVILGIMADQTEKEIAWQLGISCRTVSTYVCRAKKRLGVQSQPALVYQAIKRGLVPAPVVDPLTSN